MSEDGRRSRVRLFVCTTSSSHLELPAKLQMVANEAPRRRRWVTERSIDRVKRRVYWEVGSYFRKEHVPNLLQGEIFLKPSFCLLYSNLIIWLNESGSRDSEIHLKNLYSS